ICRGDDFTCGDQVREACLEEERRCRCEKYSWHGSSSRLFSETFESLAAGDLALEDWLRENSELFPCCLNCQEAEEQFETLVNSVGLALVIFGITGVLVFSILLLLPRRIPRLTPADLRYFEAPELLAKRDGAELHEKIPRHMWCVSLEDLRQFRRLVMHAVARGQIQPTENDNFEASDLVIGPSVYTVTEQFVKPLTAAAGKMSWALLRNPEGLRCDLFVTHAWAEGVYEFIDKVERSWPRGAKAAYVCFLSNPQNLDISSLLTSPSASPFALALESASTMSHCRTCVGLYGFSFLFVAFWGGSSKNNRNTEIHVGVQIQIFPLVLWLSGRPPPPPVQLGHRLLKNLEAKAVSHVFSSAFLQFVSSGSCLAVNGRIRTASFSCINGQNPMFFHSCSSIARKSEPTSCIQRSRLKSCSMGSRCLQTSYACSETH
ncbi:unnamed protein product, partial [Effrenium voratum]